MQSVLIWINRQTVPQRIDRCNVNQRYTIAALLSLPPVCCLAAGAESLLTLQAAHKTPEPNFTLLTVADLV